MASRADPPVASTESKAHASVAPEDGSVRAELASVYTELVLHGLNHLDLAGPSQLHEPRYLSWARANLTRHSWSGLLRDAPIIAARHSQGRNPLALEALLELHSSVRALRRTAAVPLEELHAEDACRSAAAQLATGDRVAVDILRADLALAAESFERDCEQLLRPHLRQAVEHVRPALACAAQAVPELAATTVELSFCAGPRGRGLPQRIVGGAPAPWHDGSAEASVVLACHEVIVRQSATRVPEGGDWQERYTKSEWLALTQLAQRLRSSPLAAAHAGWLSDLNLEPLCSAAARHGLASSDVAQRLANDRAGRAALFAELSAGC